MKQKMLKLMLLFLIISLISSSKENTAIANCKCLQEEKFQGSESIKVSGGGGGEEYQLLMLPGSNLFFY
jgi:hypothetical protein